jgi:uncharacterized membrane protein
MATTPPGAAPGPAPAADPAAGSAGVPGPSDAALAIESTIARLLVIGTYVAIALVLVGVGGMLADGVDPLAHGTPPGFDLGRLPGDLLALRPEGFLWAGLVTVLALPVGRVVVAGVGFFAAHDRRLTLVSVAVLLVVLASVLAALGLQG